MKKMKLIDRIKSILDRYKSGEFKEVEDENGTGGFWDLAGELSVQRQIETKGDKLGDLEAVWIDENEQMKLYEIFQIMVELTN